VYSVIGLIVLVIFIALLTNAVHRWCARKFDRDVAEAAAEAAATSRSPFDHYTYSNNNPNNSGGGGRYPYSDTTRGTCSQAPMLPTDTYGMSEMTQYDPYAAGPVSLATVNLVRTRSRLDSESTRTPGIAGVGAGNLAHEPSWRTPYHAFAGPGPQPHETMDRAPSGRYRPWGVELLEVAGLAGTGIAAMAAATNNNNNGNRVFNNRRPSGCTHQTHGSMRSQDHSQGHSSSENYPAPLQPGYQAQAQASGSVKGC
jgi:type II secretory pathway pseudopilin PulG